MKISVFESNVQVPSDSKEIVAPIATTTTGLVWGQQQCHVDVRQQRWAPNIEPLNKTILKETCYRMLSNFWYMVTVFLSNIIHVGETI